MLPDDSEHRPALGLFRARAYGTHSVVQRNCAFLPLLNGAHGPVFEWAMLKFGHFFVSLRP